VLHASSPVLAALFALAERTPVSGADLMLAYAVGFEAGVRTGWSAPGHHKGGWHLLQPGVAVTESRPSDRRRAAPMARLAAEPQRFTFDAAVRLLTFHRRRADPAGAA